MPVAETHARPTSGPDTSIAGNTSPDGRSRKRDRGLRTPLWPATRRSRGTSRSP